jgi:GNAT superfamily N-acetyltransferase
MTMLHIRRAVTGDLPVILTILHDTSDWLAARGLDQWPHESESLTPSALTRQVLRREMFLAADDAARPAGVIASSRYGNKAFWTPAELGQRAAYLSKMAIARDTAPAGTGQVMLRWAVDRAWRDGLDWVRLDAWRTNTGLHEYYRRRGWAHVRTADVPGRKSGALFQVPARHDPEVRALITETPGNTSFWKGRELSDADQRGE